MFWILGINKRNINYITKLNPAKEIRLADNKFQTKEFLSVRWIPVPQTFAMIKNRFQLQTYDFSQLHTDFVVKPNKWSRGRWIMVTSIVDADKISPPTWLQKYISTVSNFLHYWYNDWHLPQYALKTENHILTPDQYKRRCVQILDGWYSLWNQKDSILVEEKIIPGAGFEVFCKYGLADLRIICYRLTPIVAMLRLPTTISGGKANLHAWGIGLGINMWTGRVTSLMQGRTVYQKNFPEAFAYLYHKKIPFWDDVLLYSSKIQFFVNLWYMALDRVITKNGPKLLELNARAGMEIQNVTLSGLEKRLQKINDIKVYTPEQGVALSHNLFGQLKHDDHNKKIIYLSQKGKISNPHNDTIKSVTVRVKCDLSKSKNYMSPKVAQIIKKTNWSDYNLFLPDTEITFKYPTFHLSKSLISNQITLWKDILSDFLIKPIDTFDPKIHFINAKYIIEDEISLLHYIDQKISSIKTYTNTTKILRPTNYLEEFDNFVTYKGDYNPSFKYKFPQDKELQQAQDVLQKLQEKYFGPNRLIKSKFGILLKEKIQEQIQKIGLIKAYKNQDFWLIQKYNQLLYWKFDIHIVDQAEQKIQSHTPIKRSILWRSLSKEEIKSTILHRLHDKEITGVKVRFVDNTFSRLSVTIGAISKINILSTWDIRAKELEALLAHEIDVHLVRHIQWSKKGRNIFRSGTSGYLKDEEWLAIYNAIQIGEKFTNTNNIYYKYYLCYLAQSLDFKWLVAYISHMKEKSLSKTAFKTALRLKRGIKKTNIIHPGTVFYKDKLYLEWYQKITHRIANGWDINKLMIWKIKIEDLEYI
jgi:hypothetical protein